MLYIYVYIYQIIDDLNVTIQIQEYITIKGWKDYEGHLCLMAKRQLNGFQIV